MNNIRLNELREYRLSRNTQVDPTKIRAELLRTKPTWNMWKPEEQEGAIRSLQDGARISSKSRLAEIRAKVSTELRDVRRSIEKEKFPLRYSSDIAFKTLGEQQRTNALLFLASSPLAERIAAEIRTALDTGELDYAHELRDNCLNDVRKDFANQPMPTEMQTWLMAELTAIYDRWEGKGKFDALEGELKALQTADVIATDFQAQEARGVDALVSLELFPLMADSEREECLRQVSERGEFVETVSFRRRAQEALQSN